MESLLIDHLEALRRKWGHVELIGHDDGRWTCTAEQLPKEFLPGSWTAESPQCAVEMAYNVTFGFEETIYGVADHV